MEKTSMAAWPIPRRWIAKAVVIVLAGWTIVPRGVAQEGTLAEPFPAPAANAALNYQRAMLHLAHLDYDEARPLEKPIWETLPIPVKKQLPREVSRMLQRGRFAVRAAATGSRIADCNFGIDFSELGAAARLPHAEGMIRLGRLLALRGAQAESQGDWEEAAVVYFDGLRMGRHLTHQNTAIEALAGIEIFRNHYFALARWATRCPTRPLVARAFGLLESMQDTLVHPSQVLAREASVLSLEFDRLQAAYPEGPWARMILESFRVEVTGDRAADAARAITVCVEQGVPRETFDDPMAFHDYVAKLQATALRFTESVAASMTLPPQARLERARALNRKYSRLIALLASDTLVDPVELGTLFSEHAAELTLARLALAVSASKQDDKFPGSLQDIEDRFGGVVPLDPYSREPVAYRTLDEARHFELAIPRLGELPEVKFTSLAPAAAE
ncbi:MAG: hypothetical protein AAGF97_12485 [Planctomycetota bacterium]